jgi:hypothetical protein
MTEITQEKLSTQELEEKVISQGNEIFELKKELKDLVKTFTDHQHTGTDKTKTITGVINLNDKEFINIGDTHITSETTDKGLDTEEIETIINGGPEENNVFGSTSSNTKLILKSDWNNRTSSLFSKQSPIASGSGVNTVSGASILTDNSKSFVVDSLIGAVINVYSGTELFQTAVVSSNTASTITITETWVDDITNASYIIYSPVELGNENYPWKTIYVGDSTFAGDGGIRFGYGPTTFGGTWGDTVSLLYVESGVLKFKDPDGDIYTVDLTAV